MALGCLWRGENEDELRIVLVRFGCPIRFGFEFLSFLGPQKSRFVFSWNLFGACMELWWIPLELFRRALWNLQFLTPLHLACIYFGPRELYFSSSKCFSTHFYPVCFVLCFMCIFSGFYHDRVCLLYRDSMTAFASWSSVGRVNELFASSAQESLLFGIVL